MRSRFPLLLFLLLWSWGCGPDQEGSAMVTGSVPEDGGPGPGGQQGLPGISGVASARSVIHLAEPAARGGEHQVAFAEDSVPGSMPLPLDLPVPPGTPREVAQLPGEAPAQPLLPPGSAGPGVLPDPPPLPNSPAPASSFKSLPDNNKTRPPDTHGAVGPNHLMTTLNTEVLIQDRAGKYLYRASLGTFWKGYYKSRPFDPRVHYDPAGKRWITVACADSRSGNSALLVAVSQTSDPMGKWSRYRLDADPKNTVWFDFPSVGFNKSWIVVQGNMYTVSSNPVFNRSHIWVFDKADLYKGGTGKHTLFSYNGIGGTQAPAITHGTTSQLYLVSAWSSSKGCLRVFHVKGSLGSEKLYSTGYACGAKPWITGIAGRKDFAPQKGTSRKIQVNDARMRRVVFRNGYLWASHTVILAHPSRSSVQWWRLNPGGAGDGVSRIDDSTGKVFLAFPSIAVNRYNDVLIGYSRFSATTYASAAYSFRYGSEASMKLQPEKLFKAGEAPYYKPGSGRNRWGDYSATVVDPKDDINMWTIQEYAAARSGVDRWGTWWAGVSIRPLANGAACTSRTQCRSDSCADGVCCDVACGGGCQACSVKAGAAKDGTCALLSSGKLCRKAAGVCDLAETCTGKSGACPTNKLRTKGTSCRKGTNACDPAEACTGTSAACPADKLSAKGTFCRAAVPGGCDVAETCTGASALCPKDQYQPKGAACRAAAGACDVAEACTGASGLCPKDQYLPTSTVCRKTAAPCDAAESCTGASALCPEDQYAPKLAVCRAAAGVCDAAETCSGASAVCPVDRLLTPSHVCRPAAGACDLAENCTGASVTCPFDGLRRAGKVCRAAAGVCDAVEACSGASALCPTEAFMAAGVECRGLAGRCDVKELCDGATAQCPTDELQPAATVCREATGDCDLAESCDGVVSTCPADLFKSAGQVCRASLGECDVAEQCPGSSAACPGDEISPDGVPCAKGAGSCVKGACKASGDAGPGDADLSSGDRGPAPQPGGCSCDVGGTSPLDGMVLYGVLLFFGIWFKKRKAGRKR